MNHRSRAVGAVIRTLFAATMFSGCGFWEDASPASSAAKRPPAITEGAKSTANRALVLHHDFGIVRPGVVLSREFAVRNSSQIDWKLRETSRSCVCAVVEATAPVIAAGDTQRFTVLLRVGQQAVDKSESVHLRFHEAAAPLVVLRVSATVREPLSALPTELHLPPTGAGREVEGDFQVHNYSDDDWEGIDVVSVPDWLQVKIEPIPAKLPTIRQSWQVIVTAVTHDMSLSGHSGVVKLRALGADLELDTVPTTDVPVFLPVRPPVTISPAQLFFGRVHPSTGKTRSIVIQFSIDCLPKDTDRFPGHIDAPPTLSPRIDKISAAAWRLTCDFAPQGQASYVREEVAIRFDDARLLPVSIPVIAQLVETIEDGK